MSISRILQPKVIFILIILLFISTRLYKITDIPPSVYWDEASIAYNGYSIAETGRDEWGESFPLHFRAFGEFKLPVYIYSAAFMIKLFGLNEFSLRVPAVIFSLGVVVFTFLLSRKLSGSINIGLMASFFVVICPWMFIFSRTGYEATAGLMFYLLAIYLFLLYEKNKWLIFFSVLCFVLSAYSYNSFRILAPISLIILFIYQFKQFKVISKKSLLPLTLSLIVLFSSMIPIYKLYRYDAGFSRIQTVSSEKSEFFKNYFYHFSPSFLIFDGDSNLRSQQEGFGQLFLPQVLLLPFGIMYIFMNKSGNKYLLLVFLFLSFIPAAITKESPHALRSISAVPFLAIVAAMGVDLIRNLEKKKITELITVVIFSLFFVNYFISFINNYSTLSSKDWQYGYKEIFHKFENDFSRYEKILISDEYAQPYIFALFYQQFDPNKFRNSVIRNSMDQWGFSTVSSFDKFKFGKVNNLLENSTRNALIFSPKKESLSNLHFVDTVKFKDGQIAFWVYKTD